MDFKKHVTPTTASGGKILEIMHMYPKSVTISLQTAEIHKCPSPDKILYRGIRIIKEALEC